MKSKHEILLECRRIGAPDLDELIYKAMDEYAKQEAIEFAKWCGENCKDDLYRYNITSLYYIYLKSKP